MHVGVGVVEVVLEVLEVVEVVLDVVDVMLEVVDLVVEVRVELIVGLQEHAELYRAGAVPQAAVALLGKPVVPVAALAVKVAQNAASEEYTAGL